MPKDRGPYTDAHERTCLEQLKVLTQMDQMLERCERAKFNCSELRRQRQELYDRLEAIRQEFFCDGTPAQRKAR